MILRNFGQAENYFRSELGRDFKNKNILQF